jgi:hypothetical protein
MKLTLAIEQRSKHVPYPVDLDDGRENHGFRVLKSDPSAIETIPEIQDCPALREALVALNAPDTPFFTVGCEKRLNRNKGSYWRKGYLEFSFNYAEWIGDASSYFPVFFHFHHSEPVRQFLSKQSIELCWELQPVRFEKIDKPGFTCCVWITTGSYPTAAKCKAVWDEAVRHVTGFLMSVRPANLRSVRSLNYRHPRKGKGNCGNSKRSSDQRSDFGF